MRGRSMMSIAAMGLMASVSAVSGPGPNSGPSRNPSRGTGPGRQRAVARLAARAEQVGPRPPETLSRQRRRWIYNHPCDSRA
jgi:hypothetical protein